MPEQVITLIKGDKMDSDTDYSDNLPVNVSGVLRQVGKAQGYMLQEPGLTSYGIGAAVNPNGFSFYYPDDGTATFRLTSAGLIEYNLGVGFVSLGAWLINGDAADYEVRMTEISGSFATGTVGSWVGLGSTRTWTETSNGAVTGLLELRAAGDDNVLSSANVTLTAPVDLSNESLSVNFYPDAGAVGLRLNNDGNLETSEDGTNWTVDSAWKLAGSVSEFECRMSVVSGSFSSGTTAEWLSLSDTRAWTRSIGADAGSSAVQGTLEIREADTETVMATSTVTLTAESQDASTYTYVIMDETDSYDRSGDLTGNSDTKLITLVFRIKITGSAIGFNILHSITTASEIQFAVYITSGPDLLLNITGDNSSEIHILNVTGLTAVPPNTWVTIMLSIDMDSGVTLYFDDTAISLGTSTFTIGEILDITNSEWYVMESLGDASYISDLAYIWFDNSSAMDISIEANRRKFIDANGCPVNLGASGQTPTGSQPILYLNGDSTEFYINKGSGGNFTESGTIGDGTDTCP